MRGSRFSCSAHIDVVEALKADWSPDLDPFVFTERDGYYYGRGTADDKAMAAIFVANAIRMVREKYVPDRDIDPAPHRPTRKAVGRTASIGCSRTIPSSSMPRW